MIQIHLICLAYHVPLISNDMCADMTVWELSVALFERVVERCEARGKSSEGSYMDIHGQREA